MQRQGVEHGSLQKLTPTRAAFARPGPGTTLFPDVVARMQPSDSLPPSATTPVPLAVASLVADACAVPREADDTCARKRAVRRRRVTGSPQNRRICEERRGPSRLRGHPLRTCCGRTPRRIRPPPRPLTQEAIIAFTVFQNSRHPESLSFGAAVPRPARSPAYASPRPFLAPSQGWLPAGWAHP